VATPIKGYYGFLQLPVRGKKIRKARNRKFYLLVLQNEDFLNI
jgi:hypothetical protein